jgi:predicted transposase YdaD
MNEKKRMLLERLAAAGIDASTLTLTELAEIIKTEGLTREQVKEILKVLRGDIVDETDKPAS